MAFERFFTLDKMKQEHILRIALEEFADHSFNLASINRISKRAGLSAGALYYYFSNKEDLFNSVLDFVLGSLYDLNLNVEDLLLKEGYWKGIEKLVFKRFSNGVENPILLAFIQRVMQSSDPTEKEGQDKIRKSFLKIFEYGYERQEIRQDLPKSFLFEIHYSLVIQVNQWMMTHLDEKVISGDMDNLKELCEKAVGMIQRAMTSERD